MALTDLIEQELLATLDGDTDAESVLARYSGSKGPLYAALARATKKATDRFREARESLRALEARRRAAAERAEAEEEHAIRAERRAAEAERRLQQGTDSLRAQEALLDQARTLREAGFDEESLAALAQRFTQIATAGGLTPAEAVARFLKVARDLEALAAFERQAREAEARARQAEADAERRQRNAKVRKQAVDWAEWLLRRGITAETVGAWTSAAEKLGLAAENLARGLAEALERFGSLEAACQAKVRERDALDREIGRRRAAIAKLRAEQDRIGAALEAVAEGGLERMADAQEEAAATIHTVQAEAVAAIRATERAMVATLERFERVTRDAAVLEPAVRFARALMNPDEPVWLDVAPEQWVALLGHLGRYLKNRGDPEAPPPDSVDKGLHDRVRYPALYGQPQLRELAAWLAAGLPSPSKGGRPLLTPGSRWSRSQATTERP